MARGPGRGPRVDIGKPLLKTPEYVEEDCGHDTPCWVWQRSVNNKGYGRIRRFNAEHLAHHPSASYREIAGMLGYPATRERVRTVLAGRAWT